MEALDPGGASDSPAQRRRGQSGLWIALALVLLIRLPFLNQAIQGDDHIYLTEAEHALIIGPVARLIDEKNPDQVVRETIKQEMTEAFSSYVRGNSMPLPSTVFIVTARCR